MIEQPCQICGSTTKVEAHHPDYSKPLEVEWLCGKHHREHHKKTRVIKGAGKKGYYKILFVTKELHHTIKVLATQSGKTMIDYLEESFKVEKELNKKGKSLKDYPIKVS